MAEREDVFTSDGKTVSHEVSAFTAASIVQDLLCVHTRDTPVIPRLLREVRHALE